MIRVVLADDERLVRGAIATLLNLEDDVEVVAEVGRGDEVVATVVKHRADIAVLDVEMPGMTGLEAAAALHQEVLGRPGYLRRALAAGARGFLAKDAPVDQLAGAIRTVYRGGRFIDSELAADAMMAGENPLTAREIDVLRAASTGASVAAIARTLHLSEGTVRNYLSSAISKLGEANRIAAIRKANAMGWL